MTLAQAGHDDDRYCRVVLEGSPRWQLVVLAGLAALAPVNVKVTAEPWTELQLRPLVMVALVIAIVLVGFGGVEHGWRPDLVDALAYCWVLALWASALFSDDLALGAGGAARFSVAALLIPATRSVVRTAGDRVTVLRALAVGSALGAAIGLGYWALGAHADGSRFFVGQVTRLGPFDRLTRPWSHANIAAMALGMTLPTAAMLPRRWMRIAAMGTMTVALVLTVSRGGLIAAAVAAATWLVIRRRRDDAALIGALAAVAASVFVLSSAWGVRVDQLGDRAFYAATIEVPDSVVVDDADGDTVIEVVVRNDSASTWQRSGRDRVQISARWIGPDGLIWTEDRWALPRELAPGEAVATPVTLAPRLPVGDYEVRWDLLIDQVAYFDQFLGEPAVTSRGEVTVSDVEFDDLERYDLVGRSILVGRVDGWRIAWYDFASSPLVGVGPNQFGQATESRLVADGRAAGSHAHNIVLEPLAAWGLLGAVPFFALGMLAVGTAVRTAWRSREPASTAIAAALVAVVVHGVVDWPLVVITTCIPVGLIAGLALAPAADR